jgi:hypothetical protein
VRYISLCLISCNIRYASSHAVRIKFLILANTNIVMLRVTVLPQCFVYSSYALTTKFQRGNRNAWISVQHNCRSGDEFTGSDEHSPER